MFGYTDPSGLAKAAKVIGLIAIIAVLFFGTVATMRGCDMQPAVSCNAAQYNSQDQDIRKRAESRCREQAADQMAGDTAHKAQAILNQPQQPIKETP